MKNRLSSFQPNMLLRSGSLDRIRQFPSYLCRRGSGGQLVTWIYNSRTVFTQALSFTHEQLRSLMLVVSVYLMVGLVALQLAAAMFVLSVVSTSLPNGMIFLLACILITSFIGFKTIPTDTKLEKRQ
ncbi:uncharacterized protein LOC111062310 [Nilaparvata lugens]|uniref:uncharacterized protein LOC111062310 n=1 Tax=Nilaparvata lugens TaxID=108931 RepID=UPI00193C9707|nr:uncharacterized protein LOC111062310 [Nilaparvata lugens]